MAAAYFNDAFLPVELTFETKIRFYLTCYIVRLSLEQECRHIIYYMARMFHGSGT
jgi:hypothetical protein